MGGDEVMVYLKMLLYEKGNLSLNRVIAASGWIAFLAVSLYLAITGQSMQNYDTFCIWSAGGGAGAALINKTIHSTFNSPRGEMPQIKNMEDDHK